MAKEGNWYREKESGPVSGQAKNIDGAPAMGYFAGMNDLVILGIVLAGIMVGLFIWQHIEHKKSAVELKIFQMENTRLIQEWRNESRRSHEDSMEYLKGITGSLARVIRRQEEGEGSK